MSIIRFVNGYALKTPEKVVYFIPIFHEIEYKRSVDLTILEVVDIFETKDTGRKYYEGYKAHVSDETLKAWQNSLTGSSVNCDIYDMLKKALRHSDHMGLTLGSSREKLRTLEFWKENVDKSIIPFGSLKLETIEIMPSTGRLLETIVLNLQETAEKNSELQQNSEGKEAKQAELQKGLEDVIRSKFRMEDRLYRVFTKVLNEKKKRIVELEKRVRLFKEQSLTHTPMSKSEVFPQVPKGKGKVKKQNPIPSSSEDEMEIQSSPEYDQDTDIQDSDMGVVPTHQTPKSAKRKFRKISSSEKPTCSRNLFSSTGTGQTIVPDEKNEEDSSTKSPIKSTTGVVVDDSETDFTDSSQELFVPYCGRNINNTNKSKSNSSQGNNKLQDSTSQKPSIRSCSKNNRNLNVSQTGLSEPLTKKCRLRTVKSEPDEMERNIDDPNHILNQMFGSSS